MRIFDLLALFVGRYLLAWTEAFSVQPTRACRIATQSYAANEHDTHATEIIWMKPNLLGGVALATMLAFSGAIAPASATQESFGKQGSRAAG